MLAEQLLDNPGYSTHGQGVCFGHRTMVADEPGSCYGRLPVQLPRCFCLVWNEMLQGYKTAAL
jgi:hypothetical protein